MEATLVVVAKRPDPGFTKTRLCPPLSPEEAAEFYRCLMLDTLELVSQVEGVAHCVAYAPSQAHKYFSDLLPNGFSMVPQNGIDLGERLANALADRFGQGFQKVVIMNSDGPTLPLDYLHQAFTGLENFDVTLGTGHDGGYYLIGMKELYRELFSDISWSSERVISETLAICRRMKLTVLQLPQWYDVDVADDLQRLRHDLANNPSAAPRTKAFLQHWDGD